jgi:hypothetical protein
VSEMFRDETMRTACLPIGWQSRVYVIGSEIKTRRVAALKPAGRVDSWRLTSLGRHGIQTYASR